MTTIELYLTDGGGPLRQTVERTVTETRDALAETIGSGATVNLNDPSGTVLVVNSAHILYAAVTP